MKKLISLALAVVMIMCLSTVAFAETANAPGNYTADVTGSYVGKESKSTVYCVDITWSDLDFTYHAEKELEWDPDTLTYTEKTVSSRWEGEGTITITNRSNTDIIALPKYSSASGYSDARMNFGSGVFEVASAESGTAYTTTITVTPLGSLPEMDEADTIGTVTLTIENYSDSVLAEARALLEESNELMSQWRAAGGSTQDESYQNLQAKYYELDMKITAYLADGGDTTWLESDCMTVRMWCNTLRGKLNSL